MRHLVIIQRNAPTRDAQGGLVAVWSTHATVYGAIEVLTGRDLFEAQQMGYEATHKATIEYTSTITPDDRLYFDSRAFSIVHIANPEEIGREHVLLVKEDVAA